MGIHIKGIDMPPEGQGRILLVKGTGEVSDWFDLERKVIAYAEGVVEEDTIFILTADAPVIIEAEYKEGSNE